MSLTELQLLREESYHRNLSREEHKRYVHLAATVRHQVTLNAGSLDPTGSKYDRWQAKALWAMGQIALNPDANQWTVIAAEIEEAVQEALKQAEGK